MRFASLSLSPVQNILDVHARHLVLVAGSPARTWSRSWTQRSPRCRARRCSEHWYRHRTDIEALNKGAKHGAALRHLPSANRTINTVWRRPRRKPPLDAPGNTGSKVLAALAIDPANVRRFLWHG